MNPARRGLPLQSFGAVGCRRSHLAKSTLRLSPDSLCYPKFKSVNSMRKLLTLILMLFLPAFVTAEQEKFEMGVLVSLTGNWAQVGKNIQQGTTLAAKDINAAGGILGKQLTLDFQDTDEEKSGAKVVSGYRYLRQKGIKFFIGPTGVPGILALTPLAVKDDVVVVAPTATNSIYKSSTKLFNASGDNYVTTKAVAELMYRQGVRKAAIFSSLQPWESDQARIFREIFEKLGGSIVEEVSPAADQTELRVEALKIKKSNPEAVFMSDFNQIASAGRALKQQGYTGKKFLAFIDQSHVTDSQGSLDGSELFLFNPPGVEFVARYKNEYGEEPGAFADSAYDAVFALSKGIILAGSFDTAAVINSLHAIEFTGSSGKLVKFDADGLIARGITRHVIKEGKLEVID